MDPRAALLAALCQAFVPDASRIALNHEHARYIFEQGRLLNGRRAFVASERCLAGDCTGTSHAALLAFQDPFDPFSLTVALDAYAVSHASRATRDSVRDILRRSHEEVDGGRSRGDRDVDPVRRSR